MPFLRLTRDRRGHEHTFLMHQEGPGQKARVIYWYRTAPAIIMGRAPLDEEAIRTIEEQHPEIEFDWPAILALREVMSPEEEVKPERPARRQRPPRGAPEGRSSRPPSDTPRDSAASGAIAADDQMDPLDQIDQAENGDDGDFDQSPAAAPPTTFGLLDQLVGREIATRLRARHAELLARIHSHAGDDPRVPGWVARADKMDPDNWLTPEAVLEGVQHADARYDALRRELHDGAS